MEPGLVREIVAALEREEVDYIVFGGVAINLLGLARATEDIDLFIAPERENVERLKTALRAVFDDPSIEEISADDLVGDYPAVQYIPGSSAPCVGSTTGSARVVAQPAPV